MENESARKRFFSRPIVIANLFIDHYIGNIIQYKLSNHFSHDHLFDIYLVHKYIYNKSNQAQRFEKGAIKNFKK